MNQWIAIIPIYLESSTLIAIGFERIVHGGRGDYVEILPEQMCTPAICLPLPVNEQKHYYFIEHRVVTNMKIIVYEQLHRVYYADYIPGMYYISPMYLKDFRVLRKR